jgi:hypothetical protein
MIKIEIEKFIFRFPRRELKRNPVKSGSGPASVSVDETCRMPLFREAGMGRRGE